jgi:hypothetical protein
MRPMTRILDLAYDSPIAHHDALIALLHLIAHRHARPNCPTCDALAR